MVLEEPGGVISLFNLLLLLHQHQIISAVAVIDRNGDVRNLAKFHVVLQVDLRDNLGDSLELLFFFKEPF